MTVQTTVCPRVVGASDDGRELVLCGAVLPCDNHSTARGFTRPFGPEIQVMLGVSPDEYEQLRRRPGGVDVSKNPGWHSHPILGITGHLHRHGTELHGHRPEVIWGDAVLIRDDPPQPAPEAP